MRKFTRRTKIAVMLVAVAGMGACASLGMAGFREPIVSFKDIKVRGLGLSGGSLDAYLSIYNPNGFTLNATRLTYNVMVGQNQLGTGALSSAFAVQSGDSTTVRIPIDFTYAGIGTAATQMMQQGSVPYTITGDVTVGTPLGSFTRPYTGTGRFTAFGGAQSTR
jgi:LEA14-like dessication related protein